MKKIAIFIMLILVCSCSSSSDSSQSTSGINPPTWIQGYWLRELPDGTVTASSGLSITSADFQQTTMGSGNSLKTLISNTYASGGSVVIVESSTAYDYSLKITLNGMSFPHFHYIKTNSTKIESIDDSGAGGTFFIKQ